MKKIILLLAISVSLFSCDGSLQKPPYIVEKVLMQGDGRGNIVYVHGSGKWSNDGKYAFSFHTNRSYAIGDTVDFK